MWLRLASLEARMEVGGEDMVGAVGDHGEGARGAVVRKMGRVKLCLRGDDDGAPSISSTLLLFDLERGEEVFFFYVILRLYNDVLYRLA